MGNPVWNVGYQAGKEAMKKNLFYLIISGVLGAGSAYYIGKAKGKEEALSEFENIKSDINNDDFDENE